MRKLVLGASPVTVNIDLGSGGTHSFSKHPSTVAPEWTVYQLGIGGPSFSVKHEEVEKTDALLSKQSSNPEILIPWAKPGSPIIKTEPTKDSAGRITFGM